jgi:hypothetical protein
MPGENDYVLFYRASPTGARAVGYVNGAGVFVQTEPEKACHNWESIVRVGTNLLFYGVQNGVMEIGHVDDDGQLVVTQTSQASPSWWPIVGVEPDGPSYGTSNVVFYNDTGVIELGYIDHDGHLAQPTPQAFPFEPNCDYATTVGPWLLFYSEVSGLLSIIRTSPYGAGFTRGQSQTVATSFNHLITVGSRVLLYGSKDGQLLSGLVTPAGALSLSQSDPIDPDWDTVVSVGSHVLFYRINGELMIGLIDGDGKFVQTQRSRASQEWTNIINVGSGTAVLFYHNVYSDPPAVPKMWLGYIDSAGHLIETQPATAAGRYVEVVAV